MKWVDTDFAKAALALRNQTLHGAEQRKSYLKAKKDWEAARPDEDTRVKYFVAVDAKSVATAESLGSIKNNATAATALADAKTNDTTATYLAAKSAMNAQGTILEKSAKEVAKAAEGIWNQYNALHNNLATVKDALVVLDKILSTPLADTTAPAPVDVAAEKAKLEEAKVDEKAKFEAGHKAHTDALELAEAQALEESYDAAIKALDDQIAALDTSGGVAPAAAAAGPVVDVATQLKAVNDALVGIREGDLFSDNCAKLDHNNTIKSGILKKFKKGAEHTTKELVETLIKDTLATFADFNKLPGALLTLEAFQDALQDTKWDAEFGVAEDGFDSIVHNFGIYESNSAVLCATGEALFDLQGLVNCAKSDVDGVKWEAAGIA